MDESKQDQHSQKGVKIDITEGGEASPVDFADIKADSDTETSATETSAPETNEEISELDKVAKERDDYLHHLQRLQAEFDNYRKRTNK